MVKNPTDWKEVSILLTGGSGFLGAFVIQELLDKASPLQVKELRIFDLKPINGVEDSRVKYIQGDIREKKQISKACDGIDLVIHSAAVIDWGSRSKAEILDVNYQGTQNVIEACRDRHVKYLVYTSSLDVLFDGNPLVEVDENTPYPDHHPTSYCRSKYLAEKAVLEANGKNLTTCSLRPSDIYGEGDPFHIGSLISMARKGFYVRLGNGRSRCQHVYAGNIAYAHLLAISGMLGGNKVLGGQAYFITDGQATNFFTFFDRFVESAGYRIWPKNLWLPKWLAMGIGTISEFISFIVKPLINYSPKMSRFAVNYTCTDYTFNSDKARKDFNFFPKYDEVEAFRRTVEFFALKDQN